MEQPPGFVAQGEIRKVCRLQKSSVGNVCGCYCYH